MSEKKGKTVGIIINLVILAVLVFGLWIAYQKFQAHNAKIGELNRLQQVYGEHRWEEAVDGFEKLFEKYPETRSKYENQLAESYQFLADDRYQESLKLPAAERVSVTREIIPLYEKARSLGQLSESSLFSLLDCYIDLKEYGKARELIAEAETREDVNEARFAIQKAFLKRQK